MRSALSLLVLGACANAALERVYVRRDDPFLEPGFLSIEPPLPTPAAAAESASSSSSSSAAVPTSEAVASTSSKMVFAHHIVGNTYTYNANTWANDIKLAASKGIDAFALNIGSDQWEENQVANAYAAAQSVAPSFKLFISFDMTSLPCASSGDAARIRAYLARYAAHPSQLLVAGRPFVSTFAGQTCTFGMGVDVNTAWSRVVKSSGVNSYFVPSFFVDPSTFEGYTVLDGAFQWNSGWPMGNYDVSWDPDQTYVNGLGGRSYMAAASPWFFTHYGPSTYNKNFIYRGDDWLIATRFEELIAHRDSVAFVEVNTWNDYGESHYIGPIEGVQPMSNQWVDGFDHQGWLDLIAYYTQWFKSGSAPSIDRDRIFLWARLYPAAADAPDSVGRPDNWQWTQDYLWAVVLLTAPADVTLTCGSSTSTTQAPAGVTRLKLPLTQDCDVSASVARGSGVSRRAAVEALAPAKSDTDSASTVDTAKAEGTNVKAEVTEDDEPPKDTEGTDVGGDVGGRGEASKTGKTGKVRLDRVARGAMQTVLTFAPAGFHFSTRPPSYNFNAFVAASP